MIKVSIGIQARSTSTRLPGKVHEKIGNKTVLQHVMESCLKAALYLNNWSSKKLLVDVFLLVPYGDEIVKRVSSEIPVIEGPEEDVLSRYMMLLHQADPDFVCRITADCPLIPSFIISKLITIAAMNDYDYLSNAHERCRTSPDGFDCEVISKKGLSYLNTEVKNKSDREHVTLAFRHSTPSWARVGNIIGHLDHSHLALSVDTVEDLNRVRNEYQELENKLLNSYALFGKKHTHRL